MIRICHQCKHGAKFAKCEGKVPCRMDQQFRDIVDMQIHGCPIGKFGAGMKCERCEGHHPLASCPFPEGYDKSKATDGRCCS